MRLVRGLLGAILVLALVVVVGSVGLVGWITAGAQPTTSGTIHVAGLGGPVSVVRDAAGIAQITADTPHDLFLAQGYVHASERLWQMEVWRHIGAGRLSELFGADEIRTDALIRTLGLRRAAERDLAAMSPEVRDVLDAYAAGVNAYIEGHRGHLGLAFTFSGLEAGLGGGLGGYAPERWTAVDSATWQKVQSLSLGGNFTSEILRMLIDARLGDPSRTDQLVPAYGPEMPVIAPGAAPASTAASATASQQPTVGTTSSASLTAGQQTALADLAQIARSIPRKAGLDPLGGWFGARGIGSNDWVVAPSKSASGGALLANDPHLGVSMPSIWYMNGLHCRVLSDACPYDVVGVSFPGAPAVILGHNARIAWGATNVGPDVQDLVAERVDPTNPADYLSADGPRPFRVRTERIAVAGGQPVTITIRETRHGPILNDVEPLLKGLPDLYALRWTAIAEPDRTLESFVKLDTARDWATFREALRDYGSPSQNFVYADVDGHIGYQMPGYIPIRSDPADRGARPVPGWDGRHEWIGRIPFDALPRLFDPPSGIIVTANNAVVDGRYPYFIGDEWDPGYRAERILQRLRAAAASGGVSQADLSAIQLDARVLRAARVVPAFAGVTPATADGALLLDRMRSWDGDCGVESLGCAAYMSVEYELLRAVFDDDLGLDLAREYVGQEPSWQALIALLARPDDPYWDDHTTPAIEREPGILVRALDRAGRELRAAFGDPAHWSWGRLHTLTFREPTLGSSGVGPLEWYFDVGPYPVAGAAGAPLNTYWQDSRAYPDPTDPAYRPVGIDRVFDVTTLPSYRLVVDMKALDSARIVITTGNGGQPFGRHYADLIDAWRLGRTVPLPFSPPAVERSAVERLVLQP